MPRVLRYIFIVIATPAVILAFMVLHAHLTYFRPADQSTLFLSMHPDTIHSSDTIRIMTWNLGYAGLGDDMDFFYDGGKQVRTSRERTLYNLQNIHSFIQSQASSDFFLLQEADKASRRSYYINMPDSLKRVLPGYHHVFAKNYNVRFVPVPWYSPMGKVVSGIVTSSKHTPISAKRISFPGNYPYPGRLFNLQRSFTLNRYLLNNGKELVLINTHNSAFDDGGLRKKQMDFLKNIMIEEYQHGNYVIAGGDFNQCPPDFEPDFFFNLFDDVDVMYIPEDFLPGWHFVYDATVPTNRRVIAPYNPATTKTTLIDFFIVSPNIKPLKVEGIHLDFRHSDHNPVKAEFLLIR